MITQQDSPAAKLLPLLASIVTLLLAVAAPRHAEASLTVPLRVEELAAMADDIVHGTVATVSAEYLDGNIYTHHDLKVVRAYKGGGAAEQTMRVTTLGGKLGPLVQLVPDAPLMAQGEEVLLFLSYPLNRMSAKQRAQFNKDAPLAKTPQIVGGWQGKFTIERKEVQYPLEQGRTVARNLAFVVRDGQPNDLKGVKPTFASFDKELRRVLEETGNPAKAQPRAIGQAGTYRVAEAKPEALSLRAFDPLPEIAYNPNASPRPRPAALSPAQEDERMKQVNRLIQQEKAEARKPSAATEAAPALAEEK